MNVIYVHCEKMRLGNPMPVQITQHFSDVDACFVLSVGKTCIHYFFRAVCQPAIFRLLAVMHMLGCSVPPGTSVTAKHMLASCSIYYYHQLVLDIDSDSETDFTCV